jgi:RNA polymerase sigma-70 factor (ECF subfamily)
MSNAEIGETMGRSEGAVKSLYHRTLLSLRDEMMESEMEDANLQSISGQSD